MADAERMREIGRKGGAKTKAAHANDPTYYSRIAALGGKAARGKKRRKKPSKRPNAPIQSEKPAASTAPPKTLTPVENTPRRQTPGLSQTSALDVLDSILGNA